MPVAVGFSSWKASSSRSVLASRAACAPVVTKYVSPPTFSPDGRHVAYLARSGTQSYVVVDGATSPAYSAVGFLAFSLDSQQVAYWVRDEHGERVVLNGTPTREFAEILTTGLAFGRDGSLEFLARDGDVVLRVTLTRSASATW